MLLERRKVYKLILFYKMVNYMVFIYFENFLELCILFIILYFLRNYDEFIYIIF